MIYHFMLLDANSKDTLAFPNPLYFVAVTPSPNLLEYTDFLTNCFTIIKTYLQDHIFVAMITIHL